MDMLSVFGRPPVHPEDRGKGPVLLAVSWVMTGLATIVVALRFIIRRRVVSWCIDDWLMLAALLLQYGFDACLAVAVSWGFGMATENLTLEQLLELLELQKWEYITALLSAAVSVMARISITSLLVRIFGSSPTLPARIFLSWAVSGVLGSRSGVIIR